eukprot:scaffold135875_cov118-Phaeocystis_antarctica.AAC.1
MSLLFDELGNINEDISSWNTSSVTTMEGMFAVCSLAPNLQPRAISCMRLTPQPPTALPPQPAPHTPLCMTSPLRLGSSRRSSTSR